MNLTKFNFWPSQFQHTIVPTKFGGEYTSRFVKGKFAGRLPESEGKGNTQTQKQMAGKSGVSTHCILSLSPIFSIFSFHLSSNFILRNQLSKRFNYSHQLSMTTPNFVWGFLIPPRRIFHRRLLHLLVSKCFSQRYLI